MEATDYYGKYLELHDKTKGACATIDSRPCSIVAGDLADIVSNVSGLQITETWRGDLSGSYQSAIESCVNALNTIADSVSSTWASGESTYNQLLDDLNKLEMKDKEYKEKVRNEPKISDARYTETYKEEGEEPGKFVFKQYQNTELFKSDHTRWEAEVDALIGECEDLTMAIEFKKGNLQGMSFGSVGFASVYSGDNGEFSKNITAVQDDVSKIKEVVNQNSFETDGSPSGNAAVIWNFFKNKTFSDGSHLSDAAISGIMSNIARETAWKFTPEIENSIGAYGLIQWLGVRRKNLEAAAAKEGVSSGNMELQLEFLWDEAFTPPSEQKYKHDGINYYKRLADKGFFTTNDPQDAGRIFDNKVEISGDPESTKYRVKRASGWYESLKGKETVTPEDVLAADRNYDLF